MVKRIADKCEKGHVCDQNFAEIMSSKNGDPAPKNAIVNGKISALSKRKKCPRGLEPCSTSTKVFTKLGHLGRPVQDNAKPLGNANVISPWFADRPVLAKTLIVTLVAPNARGGIGKEN